MTDQWKGSGALPPGQTGKLRGAGTQRLGHGDAVQVSAGVSSGGPMWERAAVERAGELAVLVAMGRRLLSDYARPLEALRLVLSLLRPEADSDQLLAAYGEAERGYLEGLVRHVSPKADLRRRMEMAGLQMEGARQGVEDFSRRLDEAMVHLGDEGLTAFRDLRTESLRGILHPVTVLHAAFEADPYLRELFPPPRIKLPMGTGTLVAPVSPSPVPVQEAPRPGTGGLGQALGNGLGRIVRSATQSLRPPGGGPSA